MKRRVFLSAVANRYGNNVFIPYAAGLMWAYASKFPEIVAEYELGLGGMLYMKEPIADAVARLDKPDVLALSCYIWNWEWHRELAKAVKAKWPSCTIVVGGVQIPDESPRALVENPWFDFAIYGEGEGAFADFLREHAGQKDYANVGSLIWRNNGEVRVNERHAPVAPDDIPSPYLTGLFDYLVASDRWKWQALQETNRGCPYSCSFCAWGASALSKLRQFSTERIVAEFEWFGKHKVEFVFNCDANFGILKRDLDLVDKLIATKETYGYPKQMRATFAKNSNDLILDISRKLYKAGMHKATTLALQSLDEETLGLIKRKNIRYEKLAQLAARYEAEGIPTFTEIIIGLPGETWTTFVDGIDKVLEAHIHDGISIYLCVLLENTEMNTPAYRAEHGIESVPMKALLYHGTPEPGAVEELQETIIATKTMPRDDLRRVVLYGWLVQAFHGFGLTQHLARRLHDKWGLKYRDFYVPLLDSLLANPNFVGGAELARVAALWDGAVQGEPWTAVDPRFGDVSWPPEEFLFLNVACQSEKFYDTLLTAAPALTYDIDVSIEAFHDLVAEQRAIFISPAPGAEATYARDAVWYGRKSDGAKLRMRR